MSLSSIRQAKWKSYRRRNGGRPFSSIGKRKLKVDSVEGLVCVTAAKQPRWKNQLHQARPRKGLLLNE